MSWLLILRSQADYFVNHKSFNLNIASHLQPGFNRYRYLEILSKHHIHRLNFLIIYAVKPLKIYNHESYPFSKKSDIHSQKGEELNLISKADAITRGEFGG